MRSTALHVRAATSIRSYAPVSGMRSGVFDALARFGAPLESAGVTAADFTQPGAVCQIGLPPRRVDVLTEISGVTFDEAWTSRVGGEVEGRTVGFIGRAALLKNKEASGRPKDIADAARLRRTKP